LVADQRRGRRPSRPRWLAISGTCRLGLGLFAADLQIKERALARTALANGKRSRDRPPDSLLAFLVAL